MQKEGNYLCFVIALIGGILNFILGVLIAFSPTFKLVDSYLNKAMLGNPPSYVFIILAFYFIILGVWIVTASFLMREDNKLKKGAITLLILGILSFNIFAVIAGLVGIVKSRSIEL